MRNYIGGAAIAASITALALAPAGASAQSADASCSTVGVEGRTLTLNLAPLANLTLRPCVPSGVAKCGADSTYELLRLPTNSLIRLQIASCQAPPA